MKICVASLLLFLSCVSLRTFAADPQTPASTRSKAARPASRATTATSAEVEELKAALAAQQQRIDDLTQRVQQRDQAVQQLQQQVGMAQSSATDAASQVAVIKESDAQKSQLLGTIQNDVTDLKANATTVALNLQDQQKSLTESIESPLAIHYKGITITPGGFLAAEGVYRQHALLGDVNTPFNTVPFSGTQAHINDLNFSGRQSRFTVLAEGKLANMKLSGYFEQDWLSAGVTSNNNQSNSYTNRQRQLWGQAALNSGWTFTGGQMWSLATETRQGLDPRSEALPSTIDAQYHVGFSWARQFGFRVAKNFNNKIWLGFAVEEPQTLLTVHGNANNFVWAGPGVGGGLYNLNANYSFNSSPDLVFKAAFQPPNWGHYEIFGVVRTFQDRVYPGATATPATAAGAFNDHTFGAGVGFNARGLVAKKRLELGMHLFGGQGVGRYGTSSLPDVTVRPDGTIAPLHNYMALATIEYHRPKFDLYWNAGGEYASRASYQSGTRITGYGSPAFSNAGCLVETLPTGVTAPATPATCTGDTRNVIEGTFGYTYRFYNGPKGRLQWGMQYSYLVRNTWQGAGGDPHGLDNMVFTSMRYYLP